MALTRLQRDVCHALAARRRTGGASYVAGGAALGEATGSNRLSRDVDVFHDAVAAVAGSSAVDLRTLDGLQFDCRVVREYRGFVEAVVARGGEEVLIQWAADSAYRFFPLVEHDDFGLTLHPFDLATNKVPARMCHQHTASDPSRAPHLPHRRGSTTRPGVRSPLRHEI